MLSGTMCTLWRHTTASDELLREADQWPQRKKNKNIYVALLLYLLSWFPFRPDNSFSVWQESGWRHQAPPRFFGRQNNAQRAVFSVSYLARADGFDMVKRISVSHSVNCVTRLRPPVSVSWVSGRAWPGVGHAGTDVRGTDSVYMSK